MSRGHPYRYDQGFHDRHRSRFGPQDGRRDIGSPYKRQRRSSSSGNDFTTFSYEDCHQEVGLGNFNDFSAISRDTILERDRRRDGKPASSQSTSTLTVQTSRSNTANKSTSKMSPLSVTITPSSHTPTKQLTPQKSGSLLSSFQHPDHQPYKRSYGSQPTSPYRPASSTSSTQHDPRTETSHSAESHVTRPSKPAPGLLMQANPSDVNISYAGSTVTSVKEGVYRPKVEAVSPTNSETEAEKTNDETSKEVENMKRTDELLKQMEKVDKEILDVEKKISDLKEKQKSLEDELSQDTLQAAEEEEKNKENENVKQENGIEENIDVEVIPPEPKEKTLIERIYEENRRIAAAEHEQFAKIGIPLPTALPLYNQPSDLEFYEENRTKARAVQLKLVKYFQRKRKAKQMKQRALLEQYRVLHKKWMEKVEKIENNQKRKNKEARIRDSYEKIFPEIKRHREQTERFSRIGSRTNWGMSVRSDAEYEEILRDLKEKERHEKHMRQLAVDPPPLLDEDQRRVKYINTNGLIKDLKVYVEQQRKLNIWTDKEKEIFKEKYIEAPKDFEYIAKFLANKNVKDCVLYYYRTKRTGNYKKLAKKQSLKRKRLPNSIGKEEVSKSKILKPRTEGDRSESEVEEEEPFDEDSDGSEGSSSRIPISTSATQPGKITTPQTGSKAESAMETPRWSKSEREIAIEGLRLYGRNWTAISQMVKTKTEAQCKNFYFNYKRKLDLEHIIAEHNASKIQRQESEETISASEASDDAYEVPEERPSIARNKHNARETRSQTAERRAESTTGPTLRNSRGQRNTRNKSADGKPSRGQTQGPEDVPKTKLHEVEEPVSVEKSRISIPGSAGSDEAHIIVVDTVESGDKQEQMELVRGVVGSHEHPLGHVSPIESYVRGVVTSAAISVCGSYGIPTSVHSSLQVDTASPAVTKATSASDRQQTSTLPLKAEAHVLHAANAEHPHTAESLKVAVNLPSAMVYPSVSYRHLSLDKPGRHSEALQNLARNRVAGGNVGTVDNSASVEEPADKNAKEKIKKIRFPDPQLPKYEQNEAIGIFNQFSPCIPPDTTSRQQVRTQRLPRPSFHPAGMPMHPFVHAVGPHGAHFPPEMFIPIPHPPGFDPMYSHPQFLEFFHPGMERNIFSARLMEEAARANQGTLMWPPVEHPGLIFATHPPFVFPPHMEPITPTEHITRRRESTGHELISPVPSTRCRSVETSAVHSRARTPEQLAIANSKPLNQQRSASLTDVHSWATAGSGDRRTSPSRPQAKSLPIVKDGGPDQVKSYEPFNALMNAAVGARPMASTVETNRVEAVREQRVRESLKISEAERAQAQFTRQSCVVTNTSVLHVSSSPKDTSGQETVERHGISSGLAPPQPPPLLSITGTHPTRSEDVSSKRLETRSTGRKQPQESPRVLNPREFSPSFSHSPKEQHPPPLVKDTPSIGLRHTPPTAVRDVGLVGRVSNQEVLPCGCTSTEPCKHQLYSQEVPYVQRIDSRSWPDVEQRQSSIGIENIPWSIESTNRGSKTIFRPWTENIGKESVQSSPLRTVSPPIQLQQQSSKRLCGSPLRDVRTASPGALISHVHPQQPGVLISPPVQQHGVLISRPPSEQHGEAVCRLETLTRPPPPQDEQQRSLPDPLPHERGPRSVLSHVVPHDAALRSSETLLPQESISLAELSPQPSSSTPHVPSASPSAFQSVLRPPPQLVRPRSRSPQPQQLVSSQSSDPSSMSSPQNIRESSIIRSPHPPPLLAPVLHRAPQPSRPVPDPPHYLPGAPTRAPFSYHPELLSGASRPSPMDLGMPYAVTPKSSGIPPSPHHLSNQPTTQKPTQPSQFPTRGTLPDVTSQRLPSPVRPEIMSSGNAPSSFIRDSTRFPRSPFESFSEQSRSDSELSRSGSEQSRAPLEKSRTSSEQFQIFSEQARTASQQACTDSEQSRVSLEKSRTSSEQFNILAEHSRASSEQSQASMEQPDSSSVQSSSPGYSLVKSPLLADNSEVSQSPFLDHAELDQPHLDAPVDIQRHVNPLYTPKTSGKSSESCEDDSKSPESSARTLTNITVTSSPPEEFSATPTKSPEQGTISDLPVSSTSMTSNPGDKDVEHDPDDEVCESREDNRSIAGSSSFGFESPDDEDHELRMRFFPPGDTSDSGDIIYGTQDPSCDQRMESDEPRPDYSDVKQIDGSGVESASDVEDEKQESAEEFSNADETCIPSDSTYIDSEQSAGETVHNSHRDDSSTTQDVVDSTVSDVSEFEQPSTVEKQDRNQDVPCKETRNSFADTGFDNNHSKDDKNHISLQDEAVSGIEGDNDASEEDNVESSGIEMDRTSGSGVVVDTICEVKNAQDSEVDSSGDIGTLESAIKHGKDDKGNVDTRDEVDTTEGNDGEDTCVVNDGEVMDNVRDISVCVEDITGILMEENKATYEEAGELRDKRVADVRCTREDEGYAVESDDVDQIPSRTADVNSSDELVMSVHGETNDEVTADLKETLDSETNVSAGHSRSLTSDPTNTREADARGEISGTENSVDTVSRDIKETVPNDPDNTISLSCWEDSHTSKEVSSSSDRRIREPYHNSDVSDDEVISEANQSQESQEVNERRTTRDESSVDVTDNVDSSTDRMDTQILHAAKTSHLVEESVSTNQSAPSEDFLNETPKVDSGTMDSPRDVHVTSSEEHVTSSGERVTSHKEHVTGGDEYVMSSDEQVTGGDDPVISSDEHVDSKSTGEESEMAEIDVEVSQSYASLHTREDLVDRNETNEMREGNEDTIGDGDLKTDITIEENIDSNTSDTTPALKHDSPGSSNIEGEHERVVDNGSTHRDTVPTATITPTPEISDEYEGKNEVEIEIEGRQDDVPDESGGQQVDAEVNSHWDNKIAGGDLTDSAMETRNVSTDNELVTSAEGNEGYNRSSKDSEGGIDSQDESDDSRVSTNARSDDRNIIESSSRKMLDASQDAQEEHSGQQNVINNDITSTVGQSPMSVTAQHSDTQISSTFETSTSYQQHGFSPSESNKVCRSTLEMFSSCVSTSNNIARQQDEVATSSDIPNISDISSSDASECAENANEAEARASSPQMDMPDSAQREDGGFGDLSNLRNELHDLVNISRRSSEDSTSNSEEPSTTNFNEPKTRPDSVIGDHVNDDVDLSGNEAESLTKDVDGECRIKGDRERPSLDDIVDSSTVSPVSFTDDHDISHPWASLSHADTSVDTTGYSGTNKDSIADLSTDEDTVDTTGDLEINKNNTANISSTENTVDSTEYLGINRDNGRCLITTEDAVGTTMDTPGKYDITVEAISSDEEELEEGEIAATPGEPDDVTGNDVTSGNVTPGDVTPELMITSSGSYYPPLDTIPISPPADTDPSSSSSAFLDFGSFAYSSTQLAGSSQVPHSVFPFSALNVRSAPNSNCSSPVPMGFGSGCNTPVRFQQADSSNILPVQYEPLSDDESSESHDTDDRCHSTGDTDSD